MGVALIAYVSRPERRVTLDPFVRPGSRLDGLGEAVLLHCTGHGHAGEAAEVLAKALRRTGNWRVDIKDFDDLAPLRDNATDAPGLVAHDLVSALCASIGPAPDSDFKPPPEPKPRRRRQTATQTRLVCLERSCAHATTRGPGEKSHRKNLGHFDFIAVMLAEVPDVQARIRAGELTPASAGEFLSASGATAASGPKGYPPETDSEHTDPSMNGAHP